jgi:predicted NACHT family NTPase
MLQVYKQAGHGLLILGQPGAGKTTELLTLALALLDHAEQDAAHPLPVVLNLSSWQPKKLSLEHWLEKNCTPAMAFPIGSHALG